MAQRDTLELSVVLPTYCERENVAPLLARLEAVLGGISWEAIVVDDDSPDGTADAVRALAQRDPRVRCMQRIGRRGLSSACIEGALASSATFIAVMDADLQHDETALPRMLEALRGGEADLAIGSRYVAGGSTGAWDSQRRRLSRFATRASHWVAKGVADPLSGFFLMRRDVFMARVRGLSSIGFKILLDLIATRGPPLRIVEIPIQFRPRVAGESKLDERVAWDFAMLLVDKTAGRFLPTRFLVFCAIGGLGVLALLFRGFGVSFVAAQSAAAIVAMALNFTLNNWITYRDQRLRGARWLLGLVTFVLACSVGALANVGIAAALFLQREGWLLSGLAGTLVGAVWNFALSRTFVWRKAD